MITAIIEFIAISMESGLSEEYANSILKVKLLQFEIFISHFCKKKLGIILKLVMPSFSLANKVYMT